LTADEEHRDHTEHCADGDAVRSAAAVMPLHTRIMPEERSAYQWFDSPGSSVAGAP
jgi:hypothetical protein